MLYFTSLKFLDNLPSDKHQGFKAVHWSKWSKLQSDWSIWNSKVCSSISCCIAGTSSVYFFILSISKIFLTCKPLHWYQRAFRSSQGDRLDFLYKVSYESQWKKEKKTCQLGKERGILQNRIKNERMLRNWPQGLFFFICRKKEFPQREYMRTFWEAQDPIGHR